MKILAIETSCDETGISLVEATGGLEAPHFEVLGEALASQAELHKEYGGVYPSLAKREHQKNLVPVLQETLKKAGEASPGTETSPETKETVTTILEREPELAEILLSEASKLPKPRIDAIAVTVGPGLEPALWVGINFAKALSAVWNVPVIPTDHMEGHIASVLLSRSNEISLPSLALLVSGGHSDYYIVRCWGGYERLGGTRDDALGEAFDKVAHLLDLPYPGGPEISRLAEKARSKAPTPTTTYQMPRPMIGSGDYDLSFSGIKTHVLYTVRNQSDKLNEERKETIAREFEDAVIDVLIAKASNALNEHQINSLIVAGGVTANQELRQRFEELSQEREMPLFLPSPELATDNATMIALAGYLNHQHGGKTYSVNPDLKADGNKIL